MLSVTVICIGRLKERFWSEAAAEFTKRLSRFCSLTVRELSEYSLPENPSEAEIKTALGREGQAILKEIPSGAFVCSLCIEGKQLSSQELSQKIEAVAQSGCGKICFIIGSSFGLDSAVKEKSDMRLSFSKMTFPHQLFRVLLLEQLYRAFSITNNMKYHK